MDKKINLKKFYDERFFELPASKAKNYIFSLRYSMNMMQVSSDLAEIFVCNKSSDYDKFFVSLSITSPHLFLKDEVIRKLYNSELGESETNELKNLIEQLFKSDISLVIFPEKHRTVFGDYEAIPKCITNFIKEFGKKVRFFSLINTYFIKPVWSQHENKCETKIEQRFSLSAASTRNMSDTEYNEKFNGFMPSSASTYIRKYPLFLRGKRPAENLESIIYACPHCKNLFSLYSEISCIKCENCGTAFELSDSGELSLTRHFDSFDSAKEFQKFILMQYDFGNKLVVGYKNIIKFTDESLNKKTSCLAELLIFADHFVLNYDGKTEKFDYSNIFDIELLPNNVLKVYGENNQILLCGKQRENFYIIFDLMEKLKNK